MFRVCTASMMMASVTSAFCWGTNNAIKSVGPRTMKFKLCPITRDTSIVGDSPSRSESTRLFSSSAKTTASPKMIDPKDIPAVFPEVMRFATGYFAGQAVYSLLRLRIPDVLGSETMTVPELVKRLSAAGDSKVQEETLERVMRYVAAATPFLEMSPVDDDTAAYSLTSAGSLLQSGVPKQPYLGCLVEHFYEPGMWNSWSKTADYVLGETADAQCPFEAANGMNAFAWFSQEPELAGHPFNQAMSIITMGQEDAIVQSYDWSQFAGKTIVDVGGSHGRVVAAIQKAFPDTSCVNFDLEEVLQDLSPEEKADNIEYVAGDMFDPSTFPKNCDVIYMKAILHDWSDDNSIKILQSCRQALADRTEDGGTVIVSDQVVPNAREAQDNPQDAAMTFQVDMIMMQIKGKERTRQQWEALADAGGFVVTDITIPPKPAMPFITMKPKD